MGTVFLVTGLLCVLVTVVCLVVALALGRGAEHKTLRRTCAVFCVVFCLRFVGGWLLEQGDMTWRRSVSNWMEFFLLVCGCVLVWRALSVYSGLVLGRCWAEVLGSLCGVVTIFLLVYTILLSVVLFHWSDHVIVRGKIRFVVESSGMEQGTRRYYRYVSPLVRGEEIDDWTVIKDAW